MDLLSIKAFAFDIDGVATDGGVFCNGDGDLLRTYDAKDGFAIRMAVMNGFPVAIITGGSSESIRKRMVTSGIKAEDVFLHCRDKRDQFHQFCQRYNLSSASATTSTRRMSCTLGTMSRTWMSLRNAAAAFVRPMPWKK